ncbi:hypothetical protein BDN70DRAFT_896802 [Pholiota conissans]|uniref:Uncharacterized protein n=1 Tax=Pholiota conissans TaxID=109636 RepID=A0A9P5YWJ0_9AGAR|nr:hypothetical protein BDN70DRAFT_896802 [Pholiota conissans]
MRASKQKKKNKRERFEVPKRIAKGSEISLNVEPETAFHEPGSEKFYVEVADDTPMERKSKGSTSAQKLLHSLSLRATRAEELRGKSQTEGRVERALGVVGELWSKEWKYVDDMDNMAGMVGAEMRSRNAVQGAPNVRQKGKGEAPLGLDWIGESRRWSAVCVSRRKASSFVNGVDGGVGVVVSGSTRRDMYPTMYPWTSGGGGLIMQDKFETRRVDAGSRTFRSTFERRK